MREPSEETILLVGDLVALGIMLAIAIGLRVYFS